MSVNNDNSKIFWIKLSSDNPYIPVSVLDYGESSAENLNKFKFDTISDGFSTFLKSKNNNEIILLFEWVEDFILTPDLESEIIYPEKIIDDDFTYCIVVIKSCYDLISTIESVQLFDFDKFEVSKVKQDFINFCVSILTLEQLIDSSFNIFFNTRLFFSNIGIQSKVLILNHKKVKISYTVLGFELRKKG